MTFLSRNLSPFSIVPGHAWFCFWPKDSHGSLLIIFRKIWHFAACYRQMDDEFLAYISLCVIWNFLKDRGKENTLKDSTIRISDYFVPPRFYVSSFSRRWITLGRWSRGMFAERESFTSRVQRWQTTRNTSRWKTMGQSARSLPLSSNRSVTAVRLTLIGSVQSYPVINYQKLRIRSWRVQFPRYSSSDDLSRPARLRKTVKLETGEGLMLSQT